MSWGPEEQRAYAKKWRRKNAARRIVENRQWKKENSAHVAAYQARWSAKQRAENLDKVRAKDRVKNKRLREKLSNWYVAHSLRMAVHEIPRALIEAQRANLMVKRLMRG